MNKLHVTVCAGALLMSQAAFAHSDKETHNKPYHPPIGVMGSHTHDKGEWMTSYRYSYMEMDGNRRGTSDYSNAQIAAQGFMVAPQKMSMQMHMFGLMYGLNDKVTLMGMGSYKTMEMDHKFVMGMNSGKTFNMESKGLGDTKLTALYKLRKTKFTNIHLNAGVSLPTGSTDEKDTNSVTGMYSKLPYPMQLGSGTWDLLPGITYYGNKNGWGWGGQLNAVIRLGENNDHYSLGDKYSASIWADREIVNNLRASLRLEGKSWGNIDGADPAYTNLNMAPTVRTHMRGGERLDVNLGLTYALPKDTVFKGNMVSMEVGAPVYQDLDGIQLENDYRVMVGWTKAF